MTKHLERRKPAIIPKKRCLPGTHCITKLMSNPPNPSLKAQLNI